MPSHLYVPSTPAALWLFPLLTAKPHPLSIIRMICWGSAKRQESESCNDSEQVPQFLKDCALETTGHLSSFFTSDSMKHNIPGICRTSERPGYFFLSLWRFCGEPIWEGWQKKRATLLIFAEAVSRALVWFKQSILQHWEELWGKPHSCKMLEKWTSCQGS